MCVCVWKGGGGDRWRSSVWGCPQQAKDSTAMCVFIFQMCQVVKLFLYGETLWLKSVVNTIRIYLNDTNKLFIFISICSKQKNRTDTQVNWYFIIINRKGYYVVLWGQLEYINLVRRKKKPLHTGQTSRLKVHKLLLWNSHSGAK